MNRHIFFRILSYFKPYLLPAGLCLLLAAVINGAELAGPYIMKLAIDGVILAEKPEIDIELIGLLYLGAVLVGASTNYAQAIILNTIVERIIHNIRMKLFAHIQAMPLSFFDRNSSGGILTRVTNDVEALHRMYSGVLVALFKDVFLLLGIIIAMFELNIRLTLISFTVIPIIISVTYLYQKRAVKNFKKIRALIARINGFLAENISGMRLVQIFHREREKFREFVQLNHEYNRANVYEVVLMGLFRPAAELINSLGVAVLIWYCIPGIFQSTVEIGVLFAFITYSKKFFGPINDLAEKYNVVLSGSVSAERIFALMDNCEGYEEPEKGLPLPEIKGELEFRHVWFSYNERDWVLKDVSFKVCPGETVAFVGATGSGKSTIINLIGRFYEAQQGEILLDGVNIRHYRLGELRKKIAVVMQDVFLFSGDIESNIRLNSFEISEDEVIQAAEYVGADQFIERLPEKYHETVRERGCTLSAGQRQLLSFARAIAFNPAILVLDEATANIDTETETLIQESLVKVSRHRTTLVIAHRLSTIRNADKIIVIHKGRIREMGRHDELLAKGGIYKSLYDIQYA
ncbi:MAG: ABC transporter ATP-binding protein [Bacteroidota bacterium]